MYNLTLAIVSRSPISTFHHCFFVYLVSEHWLPPSFLSFKWPLVSPLMAFWGNPLSEYFWLACEATAAGSELHGTCPHCSHGVVSRRVCTATGAFTTLKLHGRKRGRGRGMGMQRSDQIRSDQTRSERHDGRNNQMQSSNELRCQHRTKPHQMNSNRNKSNQTMRPMITTTTPAMKTRHQARNATGVNNDGRELRTNTGNTIIV